MRRICRVSGKAANGVRHHAAVLACSKFEAAAMGVEAMSRQGAVGVGADTLEVVVCDEGERMLVEPRQLRRWVEKWGRKSPGSKDLKARVLQILVSAELSRMDED